MIYQNWHQLKYKIHEKKHLDSSLLIYYYFFNISSALMELFLESKRSVTGSIKRAERKRIGGD